MQRILVNEIAVVSLSPSFNLNIPVTVWTMIPAIIITEPNASCLLLAAVISASEKIHPLAYQSDPSYENRDSPGKVSLEISVFMDFFIQF